MNRMIILPLVLLLSITVFCTFIGGDVYKGSVTDVFTAGGVVGADPLRGYDEESPDLLYDSSGHATCYKNGTAVGEGGVLEWKDRNLMPEGAGVAVWHNTTNPAYGVAMFATEYDMLLGYWVWENNDKTNEDDDDAFSFFIGTQLGFLAVIGVVMAVSALVGLHIFGSGISDVSVSTIVKGGVYLSLFGICSLNSYAAILSIPLGFGALIFLGLTFVYTMGIVMDMV